VFGYTAEFYLSDSVESFFRNGGRSAWIVRVAHTLSRAPSARSSTRRRRAVDQRRLDKPTLLVRALNEGGATPSGSASRPPARAPC
jgi:hypothetical protein